MECQCTSIQLALIFTGLFIIFSVYGYSQQVANLRRTIDRLKRISENLIDEKNNNAEKK